MKNEKYNKDSVAVFLICKMQPKTSGAGMTNLVTNLLTGCDDEGV